MDRTTALLVAVALTWIKYDIVTALILLFSLISINGYITYTVKARG